MYTAVMFLELISSLVAVNVYLATPSTTGTLSTFAPDSFPPSLSVTPFILKITFPSVTLSPFASVMLACRIISSSTYDLIGSTTIFTPALDTLNFVSTFVASWSSSPA